jgi:glycosyltransferase involved in cell wall biosynthesis
VTAEPRRDALRIVTVVHGYPPREHAGAELCAHWLARALLDRGHDLRVFARTGDASLPEFARVRERIDGVPVTRLRTAPELATSLRATYRDERVRAAFERELADGGADVVHVHHAIGLTTDVIDAAKRAGARVVATLHDFWWLCPRGQRLMPSGHHCTDIDLSRCSRCIGKKRVRWAANFARSRPLRALASLPSYLPENLHTRALARRMREMIESLNTCDLVLSPSRFVLEEHVRHGLQAARGHYLENGIDDGWVAALPRRDAPTSSIRFGFVGSFLPSKGADLLVDAFQQIPAGAATLDLFGTSPWDSGAFARTVEASNRHPGVRFHGPFGRERLAEVLAKIDVLVVPSRWYENAPVSLDEAALAAIPVVVADHGGMAESLARRKNGLGFRPDDAADLREKLLRFVREPDLWARVRTPAQRVRTASQVAAEFERLIRSL